MANDKIKASGMFQARKAHKPAAPLNADNPSIANTGAGLAQPLAVTFRPES
jgi:hypothetical protein